MKIKLNGVQIPDRLKNDFMDIISLTGKICGVIFGFILIVALYIALVNFAASITPIFGFIAFIMFGIFFVLLFAKVLWYIVE